MTHLTVALFSAMTAATLGHGIWNITAVMLEGNRWIATTGMPDDPLFAGLEMDEEVKEAAEKLVLVMRVKRLVTRENYEEVKKYLLMLGRLGSCTDEEDRKSVV